MRPRDGSSRVGVVPPSPPTTPGYFHLQDQQRREKERQQAREDADDAKGTRVTCSECGASILSVEWDMHRDWHERSAG